MGKIDYSKINWKARTYWEFCGTKDNLMEVWKRAFKRRGMRIRLAEFGYRAPYVGFAYEKGDVVTYSGSNYSGLAVVDTPVSNGSFFIRFPDGSRIAIRPNEIEKKISIAEIPEELILLARAEAGKPLGISKCPLGKEEK